MNLLGFLGIVLLIADIAGFSSLTPPSRYNRLTRSRRKRAVYERQLRAYRSRTPKERFAYGALQGAFWGLVISGGLFYTIRKK